MPPVASPDAPSCVAVMRRALESRTRPLIVYSIHLRSTSANHPFGRETFSRREDAERFIEELRVEEPELARSLRIEEHELDAGGLN
jgi:hypothetical protein